MLGRDFSYVIIQTLKFTSALFLKLQSTLEQYVCCLYFITTVFITVGFGIFLPVLAWSLHFRKGWLMDKRGSSLPWLTYQSNVATSFWGTVAQCNSTYLSHIDDMWSRRHIRVQLFRAGMTQLNSILHAFLNHDGLWYPVSFKLFDYNPWLGWMGWMDCRFKDKWAYSTCPFCNFEHYQQVYCICLMFLAAVIFGGIIGELQVWSTSRPPLVSKS